jgi:small-conductance mechanosensitive channel
MNWTELESWTRPILVAFAAVLLALIAHRAGRVIVIRLTRISVVATALVERIDRPAAFVLPLLALQLVWQAVPPPVSGLDGIRHANGILLIAALTWLVMGAIGGLAEGVVRSHPAHLDDNLHARRVHTQARVLSRTAMGAVLVAGIALALMTFPGARQVGASLLASAGVIGLIAGIAARPVFSNLIAGLQIALAQPIRIDDVLVVEGEWGRVEEITGTYVVLAIWDQRRLIIPLQYFIDKPFQNWTRNTAQIIGAVLLWVDYTMPLEPLRREAQRVCEASPEWDGRLCKLQVTDAGERAMQLRLLVTSANSGQNWDLRCAVREALIDLMQREYPHARPRFRAQLAGPDPSGASLHGPELSTKAA